MVRSAYPAERSQESAPIQTPAAIPATPVEANTLSNKASSVWPVLSSSTTAVPAAPLAALAALVGLAGADDAALGAALADVVDVVPVCPFPEHPARKAPRPNAPVIPNTWRRVSGREKAFGLIDIPPVSGTPIPPATAGRRFRGKPGGLQGMIQRALPTL